MEVLTTFSGIRTSLPHPELPGRGTFVEDVSATFRVKGLGNGSQVLSLQDTSDMVVLRITIEAFADLGQGELHAVRNDSLDEVVLLVVIFGIQRAPVIPSEEGSGGCDFL